MIKRNELSSRNKTWRDLTCILLSERTKSERAPYYLIPTAWYSGKDDTIEVIERSVFAGVSVLRWSSNDSMMHGDFEGGETILYHPLMLAI